MVSRRSSLVLALVLSVTPISMVSAQPAAPSGDGTDKHVPDAAERKAARILADEGLSLSKRGEYQAALEKFEQAEKLVPALTIAIESARCLDKLGRLLAARERYEAIVAEEVPKSAPFVIHKAQDDASAELEALKNRIPTLSLVIEGPRGAGLELVVDDEPASLSAFEGVDRAVDPGVRIVEVRRKDTNVVKKVAIAEGEHAKARIVLPPIGSLAEAEARQRSQASLMKGIGWGGFGLAGAGLVVGVATGAAAVSTRSDLKSKCPGSKCPPSAWGEVDRYDRLRATTTTALVLGAIGGAVGTTLFLLAPRTKKGTDVQAAFGLGTATLTVEL